MIIISVIKKMFQITVVKSIKFNTTKKLLKIAIIQTKILLIIIVTTTVRRRKMIIMSRDDNNNFYLASFSLEIMDSY